MKATLISGAVSFIVMLAMVTVGRVTGFGDQPVFHFASGFFVGVVFTATSHYAWGRP